MKNLSIENLNVDFDSLILTENDSYIESYPEFIKYFEDLDLIEKHHLFISSHFVYGWMPTVLNLDTQELGQVLFYLNAAKSGHLLDAEELTIVKRCVNNSMVGTSKLLHFINPEIYAIWDSRIFRYLTGKRSSYGIDRPKSYLEYLAALNDISKDQGYTKLHSQIEGILNTQITPMRAIELLMFETDRARTLKVLGSYPNSIPTI